MADTCNMEHCSHLESQAFPTHSLQSYENDDRWVRSVSSFVSHGNDTDVQYIELAPGSVVASTEPNQGQLSW